MRPPPRTALSVALRPSVHGPSRASDFLEIGKP